jgi:hypothetical protein
MAEARDAHAQLLPAAPDNFAVRSHSVFLNEKAKIGWDTVF